MLLFLVTIAFVAAASNCYPPVQLCIGAAIDIKHAAHRHSLKV